jgi:hypothetical protein
MEANTNIWYASYGSNLLEERFLCYIRGGRPSGANRTYKGCRDKTLPIDSEEIYINQKLYFGKSSKNWDGGGVAFLGLSSDPGHLTLGRMYLITREQFMDVVKQETDTKEKLTIDFEGAMEEGSYVFKDRSWYGTIVYLGEQYGCPIFTFTHQDDSQPVTRPGNNYLATIVKGIGETFSLSKQEIYDYLHSKDGISGNYTEQELINLINEAL